MSNDNTPTVAAVPAEPVAWFKRLPEDGYLCLASIAHEGWKPLYAAPQATPPSVKESLTVAPHVVAAVPAEPVAPMSAEELRGFSDIYFDHGHMLGTLELMNFAEALYRAWQKDAAAQATPPAPDVKPSNVGQWCMSEDECRAAGIDFAAYERGVSDAAEAFGRNK